MIKKTITFEDLEGKPRTEDFWFHLNKAEVVELKMIHGDGLEGLMATLNAAKDGKTIIAAFREIIAKTVGRPNTEDGVSFDKDPNYVKRFMSSDAYSVLFMEIIEGADSGASFILGVLPKDLQEEAIKRQAEAAKVEERVAIKTKMIQAGDSVRAMELNMMLKDLTPDEILSMDRKHFDMLDHRKMSQPQLMAAYQRKAGSN